MDPEEEVGQGQGAAQPPSREPEPDADPNPRVANRQARKTAGAYGDPKTACQRRYEELVENIKAYNVGRPPEEQYAIPPPPRPGQGRGENVHAFAGPSPPIPPEACARGLMVLGDFAGRWFEVDARPDPEAVAEAAQPVSLATTWLEEVDPKTYCFGLAAFAVLGAFWPMIDEGLARRKAKKAGVEYEPKKPPPENVTAGGRHEEVVDAAKKKADVQKKAREAAKRKASSKKKAAKKPKAGKKRGPGRPPKKKAGDADA